MTLRKWELAALHIIDAFLIACVILWLAGCDSAPLQHCRYGGHWDGKAWHCMAAPEPSELLGFAPLYHGGIPKTRPTPRDPHPW